MATSDRQDAQSRRADARRQRREGGADGAEPENGAQESSGNGHSALLAAAKVAAAGAAVGAAFGAALASRDEHGGRAEQESEPEEQAVEEEHEPEQQPAAREEEPENDEAKEDAPDEPPPPQQHQPQQRNEQPQPARHGGTPEETAEVVRVAREQLHALQGSEPESVSSLARTADGWLVTLEVVELARIPDSTDVLASYEVELDENRNVVSYARRRRYSRSQSDSNGGL